MDYRVVLSPEAEDQLVAIYRYIAERASSETAKNFTHAIVEHCEGLSASPHRGSKRDDIRPGLRTVGFRRRVTVAFAVRENTVTVVGIFYGGRDIEAALREDEP